MNRWLLDTGPLVAYLDAGDPAHDQCMAVLDAFEGHLLTTGAVVVEAMHLLGEAREGPESLVKFLALSRTQIHECTDLPLLERAAQLMRKYADVPMDFADATLVLLAQETSIPEVLTLDRRGFSTFRFGGRKPFQMVLGR